jgi:hypothetical protein
MRQQRTKLVIFCVLWVFVVAMAVYGVRYFADPQREIDRHLTALRPLYEQMQRETGHDASSPVRQEWNSRRDELRKLGYLEKREYYLPLFGMWAEQQKLFAVLDTKESESWISEWSFTQGPNETLAIVVMDEPHRLDGWKAVIDGFEDSEL